MTTKTKKKDSVVQAKKVRINQLRGKPGYTNQWADTALAQWAALEEYLQSLGLLEE